MVTIENPGVRFQAAVLKGHCKLLAKGMKNSKMSGSKILSLCSSITGKTYKRGAYMEAVSDLQDYLDSN